ncbi:cytochrome (ubi)quinol oxidase subunit III [Ammoniphilus resinae]|uniref:Heme/copper-type cytochrome/quinol oxidase subunit 3 n=1 Tax=Ammoniphilus resinae TaxID=861532 RepID=A0ABS4GQX2_9BACL|nr:cytochrome (ubi)quinol oxidase subunit III [Ammoniphilus resinae]MBP1932634.1 heme/copper-type cytochrome/quinol oxidase subunit 3 [Ammoniphilus resinae]
MSTEVSTNLPPHPEKATLEGKNKVLGFWLFLGGEVILFGSLFATFIALRTAFGSGPASQELFSLPLTAVATFILLTSSLFSVLGIQAMHRNDLSGVLKWFGITVLFGLAFLGLEIYEFFEYVHEGHTMSSGAFGSAFYTLVGFHGAHVLGGVCWITGLLSKLPKKGLNVVTAPKLYVASLYWHFIDLVWVFIFTVVYLMGKVG